MAFPTSLPEVNVEKLVRTSIEIEGHGHGTLPIPAGSRVGPFVATGGVRGADPTSGELPGELADQVRFMFANLASIVVAGGASAETILKVTIWIKVPEARAAINSEWIKMFPDAKSRPARHVLSYDLPGGMLVQCEALAIAESYLARRS
jgi:enamine deaminase RidA (YjgF/YER057c/UK114 family)